jgi:hypothetical protein
MPSSSFLVRSLLFLATLSAVIVPGVSAGRLTKCKVKAKTQGVLVVQQPDNTSPASAAPTTTQHEAGSTNTSQSSSSTPSPTPVVQAALPPFDYGSQKVRGVNLGGWFLMEVSSYLCPYIGGKGRIQAAFLLGTSNNY